MGTIRVMQWLALNLAAATFMAGLILFVHVVHYPLFREIDPASWRAYHALHVRRTTRIVAPAMLIEAALAIVLIVRQGDVTAWLAGGFLLIAWIITFTIQVPLHNRLREAHSAAILRKLLAWNLLRTSAWIARSGVLCLEVL